jgi:hypothetical protein
MAKRTVQMLIDDIDGGDAVETVLFGVDGVQYEIDLSTVNAQRLRDAIEPFAEAAHRLAKGPVVLAGGRAARSKASTDRDQNRAIREWAQSKGIAVSDRGRIKQDIVARYNAEAGV